MDLNQQNFTQDILDSLGEGLFTVDKDFRINSINRAAEMVFGIKRGEVLGDFCKNIFKSDRCLGDCPIQRVLETGENVYDLEGQMRHISGRLVQVKINAAILRDEQQRPIGGVVSFRDMSYLEKYREELKSASFFQGIVGQHKTMVEIFRLIEDISESDSSVLILGESGTGKEMVANAIQTLSPRNKKPYVKINCSVFPPQMLASELFGHVKGAFTDAIKDRVGRFELANTGTIFLDEIAEMPLQMQVQLLRVLQEGTFERLGESTTRRVNVRVIAATNRNIKKELIDGNFREDLYYRLNVIPIHLPALRERRSDIPHLVQHFINKFSLIFSKNIAEIDDEAMDLLCSYDWPGNVRELENALEYAFARTKESILRSSKLPPTIKNAIPAATHRIVRLDDEPVAMDQEEKQLKLILDKNKWSRSKVAKELRIGRTTLWRRMKALGLNNLES